MLEFKLTPHHTGLTLWGDYASLERLHAFIHRIVEESHVIEDKDGFVLGLAYDVRKAFERQRSEGVRSHFDDEDRCSIFGVEILWPVILVQTGVLRYAMGFIPTSKLDQAIMFELEHVIESAVRAAMPTTAEEVLRWTQHACVASYSHLDKALHSRCVYFIKCPAKERRAILPKLMETFDPMYAVVAQHAAITRLGIIPPSAFADCDRDWPDFEW